MSYLIHFNKNHDKRNGRFTYGDGDGDGISDDHAHRSTKYQNSDGTPTKLGIKRYRELDRASDPNLYKSLLKETRDKRSKQSGWYNKWDDKMPIGKNSRKVIEEGRQRYKEYENSKEYKDWEKKIDELGEKFESGDIDDDEYDREYDKLYRQMPNKNFNSIYGTATLGKYGFKWLDGYAQKGGRDISIAYLKDLGYSEEKAEEYVKRFSRLDLSLG